MTVFVVDGHINTWETCWIWSVLCLSLILSVCVSECLLLIECHWNYRPDHCMYGSNCIAAEQSGVYILHGSRGVYHDDKQPAFRAVYDAIQQVRTKPYSNIPLASNGITWNIASYQGYISDFNLMYKNA